MPGRHLSSLVREREKINERNVRERYGEIRRERRNETKLLQEWFWNKRIGT